MRNNESLASEAGEYRDNKRAGVFSALKPEFLN